MAYVSLSLQAPLFPFRPRFPNIPKSLTIFPNLPLRVPLNLHPVLACSSPKAVPITEQDVLRAVVESDENILPCVRTYENDLARLTLVGAVDFEQALTAAAADGGQAATEHIDSGVPAMVVETVYPGPSDQHSTVSTRLFLPARKVKEKARKLRSSLTEDILSSTTSRNILSMTFRQVVLHQLWSFELVIFRPGTKRNTEDLENPREVPACLILSSSDERVISALSEAVCISALQSTQKNFLHNYLGKASSNFFHCLQKPGRILSSDCSVIIYKIFEEEIIENAKILLEDFNLNKEGFDTERNKPKHYLWTPSALSKLENIGGPDFSAWTSEFVPAYRLQIDAAQLKDVKFEGWRKSAEDKWEVLLTHSQMVDLVDIVDMYYEDLYTLPKKELSSGVVPNFTNLSEKKRSSFLLRILSITLSSGIFLIAVSAFGQLCLPHLNKFGKNTGEHRPLLSLEVDNSLHQSLDTNELEAFCISVVKRIKDALGWQGEIIAETNVGVWTGALPNYLRMVVEDNSNYEDNSTISSPSENIDADMKTSALDIATYQVVLSADGKIIGFQPMSRVAVNQWAANPLARELYGGEKLSPAQKQKSEVPSELSAKPKLPVPDMTDPPNNPNPPPTPSSKIPSEINNGHSNTSFSGQKVHYPNPPDARNPDPATLREQWRFAIKQYSRWYSQAWGTAILAGLSFFALGWIIKGENPLPSFRPDDSPSPPSSSSSADAADSADTNKVRP
ncbi:hypothetical protein FNV43_RR07505 [Rhamnella rubrinervis]|uniref:Uncharacterized protein n=1 Tax=Rhamnella rubrinervis TaxID=2594499 RepID=A0A8K0HGP3_9ROSA|nr:hypothetical protein FNV43_RR07505 [Rhamnella rubrinervis]